MAKNILEEIETKYDVKEFKSNDGIYVWPFLRQEVYFKDLLNKTGYNNTQKRTRNKFQLLKNFFYGFSNMFSLRKWEYLCFQNTNKRVLLNDKYYDVYFDAWADKLGREKTLFVEFASDSYYNHKALHTKHVISDLPFKLGSFIWSLFARRKFNNLHKLSNILNSYNVQLNLNSKLKSQFGEVAFYRFIFKIIKPKAVFVLSSFTKTSIVYAARSLGIRVVEAQHGYIGDGHPFYYSHVMFDKAFPDQLISFGVYEKNENADNFIFKPNQIIPVGGLELELKKEQSLPEELVQIRNRYNEVFCLTMQAIKEDELIAMISQYAKENPESIFFICPKDRSKDYTEVLTDNIVLSKFSIYNILSISDYNITIFSTTVIEAAEFNVKNILFNVNNLSRKYFNIERIGAMCLEEGEILTKEKLKNFKETEFRYYKPNYHNNIIADCIE